MSVSDAYSTAVRRETTRILPDDGLRELKPLAVARLHAEIANPKSPLGMKAIELAGRFKETDWFVRSTADVSIGIIAAVNEVTESATLAEYQDETILPDKP